MRISYLLAAAVMAVGLAGPVAAQTTLKFGYALAPNSHYGVAAKSFDENLAKLAPGKFKIEQFPSSALGGEREMIESLQLGNLEMVVTSSGPVGNFVPEVAIMDIPFLFRDAAHARAVLDGAPGQELLAKFPAKGLVALAWGEQGFRHLTNSKHPVDTPADLKGLKIRTMENQVHMIAFRTLGASPTPMAWPEVIQGLQQGTIDGQENPMSVIVSAKLPEVQKFLTLTRHVYSPALIIMSKRTYDKLSDADKTAVQAAAKAGAKDMRAWIDQVESKAVSDVQAMGMKVVEKVDTAKFQTALEPAFAEYAKRFGKDKIDQIRNFK
ncbi:TRAP transporter substrate-binding protein [Ferrovibrio sp.]|jgi:tripartite ATP-independent transporter DctP family solute receptor|uniref:TRAP transporter substrate-binding protein n=1 Tax=Ferrovibrio sp. TaxID=1917215 RepID=UPI0035AEB5AC